MANTQKPIGIIGAMDKEIDLLKDKMVIEETKTISGMTCYSGTLSGHPVVLVRCGIGKVNAAICAQVLILRFGVGKVINTGVAGSLNPFLSIGDIVISKDAVQHDMDVSGLGYGPGIIPDQEESFFPADEELRRRAMAAAAAVEVQVSEGRVASGDQFIADSMKKQQIAGTFFADCCEMEGAAIAQVCYLNHVPFVIIRAISDNADDSGQVSYSLFVEAAARNSAAIVRHILENM